MNLILWIMHIFAFLILYKTARKNAVNYCSDALRLFLWCCRFGFQRSADKEREITVNDIARDDEHKGHSYRKAYCKYA